MKIFVSTGEVSGDLHLSYLVKSAKKNYDNVDFYGVAGKHSEEAGVKIIQNIDELAIMGFFEVFKKYSFLKKKAIEYVEFIKKEQIKKVLLVDYGGFNLKFMELLKKEIKDIEIFYYIPPKLWVWGEKRIKKLIKADHIMVIFPWEVEFYKKYNVDVIYYGNPFSEKYEVVNRNDEYILFLPGSRKQEIKILTPIMAEIARNNLDKNYLLKISQEKHLEWIDKTIFDCKNIKIEVEVSLTNCVKNSKLAIAASGTVTLELALLGIPTIVVYKTSWINAFIVRTFLNIGFISLPNLTLNKEIFPELLQEKCNVNEIERCIEKIEKNKDGIEKNIEKIREKLSGKNIIENYATFIVKGEKWSK